VTHIIEGRRPPRPAGPVLTDDLWGLMQNCWNQEPKLRPRMSEVLNMVPSFVSEQFRRLREFSKSSPKFYLALERFFDSTEYKDCIAHLHGATLQEFVNFLDDVRRQTHITYTTSILDFDFLSRCHISMDYLENYLGGHYTTCGRCAAVGSYFRILSFFLVKFPNQLPTRASVQGSTRMYGVGR